MGCFFPFSLNERGISGSRVEQLLLCKAYVVGSHSTFHNTDLNSTGKVADRHLCSRLKSEAKKSLVVESNLSQPAKSCRPSARYSCSPERDFGCRILSAGGSQQALPDGCFCSAAARWSVITMTTSKYMMCSVAGAPADPDCVCMAQSWASLPGKGAKNTWIHR